MDKEFLKNRIFFVFPEEKKKKKRKTTRDDGSGIWIYILPELYYCSGL
jgi:hypothetical protein